MLFSEQCFLWIEMLFLRNCMNLRGCICRFLHGGKKMSCTIKNPRRIGSVGEKVGY